MSDLRPDSGFTTPSVARQVDEACDRFEAAWQAGVPPQLEAFLTGVPASELPVLLRELIALDIACRRRRGGAPRLEDYQARFPSVDPHWLAGLLVDPYETPVPTPTKDMPGPGPQAMAACAVCPTQLPTHFGRYRVTAFLGKGGFGIVYQGQDTELRREVAIKVPRPERLAAPRARDLFLAEARILASLDHPAIVPVYDAGRTDEGLFYLVSRFIAGTDLARRLQHGRLPAAQAVSLVIAVAEALHHAHRRGLVHRDVKPANILLDAEDHPFLTDFGLALRDEDFGNDAGMAGTLAYMSPEQARGEAHRVDGRTDVYSLGVVLYQLLTGRVPFRGDSLTEILDQIQVLEPRPLRQYDDRIAKDLERICLKALAKKASDRHDTALDLADELRRAGRLAGSGSPVLAPSDPVRPRIVGLCFLDTADNFKGRLSERAQLQGWLTDPAVKLVAVVGRGGMGKTALVSKVCSELERSEPWPAAAGPRVDGIAYVSFRGTPQPTVERLFDDLARLLCDRNTEELRACWRDPCRDLAEKVRFLLARFREGWYLLVLDNLEDALALDGRLSDPGLQTFVETCLTTPHGVRLLATSRERLVVGGPGRPAVRTLALDEGLVGVEAAALLRQLDPEGELGLAGEDDALLQDVGRRCHGVPRALEMVAGILAADPTLTLRPLLADQGLFTAQVVENLVSEHYRRLPEELRRLLEGLAVYDQPVPAAAVDHVLRPFFPSLAVEDGLRRLVRGYFVTQHRERATYELHPLDRQYAYGRIPAGRDGYTRSSLHRRAADYYAGQRKPVGAWKDVTDLQPQLAQLEHLMLAGDHATACHLLAAIDFNHLAVWGQSDLLVALRTRLADGLTDPILAVQNWFMLGLAHNRLWAAADAQGCFEQALRIMYGRETAGNDWKGSLCPAFARWEVWVSDLKGNLGRSLLFVGQVDAAVRLFEETVAVMRRHGQRLAEGVWLGRLGEALLHLSRLDDALACLQHALALSQAEDDSRWQVTHLSNLGDLYRRQDDTSSARRCLGDALTLARATRNRQGEAFCVTRLAQVAQQAGDVDQARTHYEEGLRLGLPPCNFLCAVRLGVLNLEMDCPKEAGNYLERGITLCRALLAKTPDLVEALYALALARLGRGEAVEALAAYQRAQQVCQARGVVKDALHDLRPLRRLRPPLPGLDKTITLLEPAVVSIR